MSKMKIAVCAIALAVTSVSVNAADVVGQGTVTFNGKLIDETCTVNDDSKDIIVTLPTLSTKTLSTAGNEAGSSAFDINVKDCPAAITKVAAHFEVLNSEYDSSTGNLINQLEVDDPTKSATKAQVRLYNDDSTQIRIGSTGKAFPVDATAHTAKMEYLGGYYATGQTTAGNVKAQVTYTLAYP